MKIEKIDINALVNIKSDIFYPFCHKQIGDKINEIIDVLNLEKTTTPKGSRNLMPELSTFKESRKKLGRSMQQVANATGVSKATISRIERCFNCDYSSVKKLNDYYAAFGV